jgi:uridine kinase
MDKAIVIGIAGGSGSGKTLVSRNILEDLGSDKVVILEQDNYYKNLGHLSYEDRIKVNYDHPDALDDELLISHLKDLIARHPINQPLYDFKIHCRKKETRRIEGSLIIILEGILILDNPILRELMDIKVFVDTDADLRFIRRLKRDILERGRSLEAVIKQYTETVRPMHLEFVEPTKRYSDIIVPEGGYNWVAVDLLKTKIKALLREKGEQI